MNRNGTPGKLTLCLTVLMFFPFANAVGQDSSDTTGSGPAVERIKFWDPDLRGLMGFYPYSYNRVDGLMAAWGVVLRGKEEIRYREAGMTQVLIDPSRPEITFSLLTPTARSFLGGTLSLEQTLSVRRRLEAGLNIYSLTSNSDTWRAHEPGISLTYLATGKDRRYHYALRGGDIFLRKGLPGGLSIQAGYSHHNVRSLGTRDVWTITKSSILETNPPVTGGVGKGLDFIFYMDRLNRSIFFPEGWEFELSAEKDGGFLGGDFDFTLWSFTLLRALKFSGESNYAFARMTGQTSSGDLPPHKLLSLGRMIKGVETFDRDFNLFDRRGDRLWFFSSGYCRLVPAPLFFSRFIYDFSLEGIFDAGHTFQAGAGQGTMSLFSEGLEKLESSVAFGVGFTVSRTRAGLYYTRSLNPDHDGSRFLLRFISRSRADNG